MKEWLPALNRLPKWTSAQKSLEEGEIVLVVFPDSPRGEWPLGRVVCVDPGKNHLVRVAQIKIGTKLYTRPITRLCPLSLLS